MTEETLDKRRVRVCLAACDGIPTSLLERYGLRALVRSIALVPQGQESVIHGILSPPLRPDERVLRMEKCPHCKQVRAITEAELHPVDA